MSKFKRVLIWLIIVVVFAAGGTALWFKMKVDEQPVKHEEPEIPEVDLPVPDPDDEE